jgi:hypothetical protein
MTPKEKRALKRELAERHEYWRRLERAIYWARFGQPSRARIMLEKLSVWAARRTWPGHAARSIAADALVRSLRQSVDAERE